MKEKSVAAEHPEERNRLERRTDVKDTARRQRLSRREYPVERLDARGEIGPDVDVSHDRGIEFGERNSAIGVTHGINLPPAPCLAL